MRLRVDGGPADGASAAAAPGPWRWIHGGSERGFAQPRAGCGLYLRRRGRYEFAGVEAWVCGSCGVLVVERAAVCLWCGVARNRSSEESG